MILSHHHLNMVYYMTNYFRSWYFLYDTCIMNQDILGNKMKASLSIIKRIDESFNSQPEVATSIYSCVSLQIEN
jgi:hypothetical protein